MEQLKRLLVVDNLTGGYNIRKPVLNEVSFDVKKGEIVGLIGQNGAGKSTTIKHILGLMQSAKGVIKVNGITRQAAVSAYQSQIAYIPETPLLYEELTVWEHLQFTAMAYGISKQELEIRGNQLLGEFQMEKMVQWLPQSFSKGMKQKLVIMCALLVQSSLLVVDEPFVGLDPKAIRALLNHLIHRKSEGCGILLSTHILSTAQNYCDRIVLLHRGKILLSGTLSEIRQQARMPRASLEEIFHQVTEVDEQ